MKIFTILGPFLVVAPATVLYNWVRELSIWADFFNVVVYMGKQDARTTIRFREFYYRIKKSNYMSGSETGKG
jgi:SNF2 family DNA or RNA helicase